MKIAMFTNSMHRWSLEKCFETASRLGYDGIEIWGGRPHAYAPDVRPQDADKINELSARYKLPVVCYSPESPFMLWREERWLNEGIEYIKQCLDVCKAIHCPYFVMAPFQCSYGHTVDEDWDRFMDCMKKFAQYTEEIDGPVMLLETLTPWEGNILLRVDDTVRALRTINSPKVKAMVDLVAAYTVGEPSSLYFDKLGKDLVHVHLVDGRKDSEDHLIPGDGELPMAEVMSMLRSYGYEGYCTVEFFDEYRTEPILHLQRSLRSFRSLQAQAAEK